MPREILIHVGAGKTGTSALQQFFRLNVSRLERAGLTIPEIATDSDERFLSHHPLSGAGRFKDVDPFPYWKKIARLRAPRVLVSSEIFHSRLANRDGIEFYEKVRKIFSAWRIRIVFYIRREDQWIQSAYEQWIKTGELRSGETVDELAARFKKSQASQIRKFAQLFGAENLIVRPYEKSQLRNGDVIDDFLHAIGIENDDRFERPTTNPNPSLPANLLNFKRVYNSVCASREEAQLVNGDLKELATHYEGEHNAAFVARQSLSSRQTMKILDAQKEDYEWIARELLGRPDGVLFEAMPEVGQEDLVPTSDDSAESEQIRVMMYFLKKLYMRNRALQRRIAQLEEAR